MLWHIRNFIKALNLIQVKVLQFDIILHQNSVYTNNEIKSKVYTTCTRLSRKLMYNFNSSTFTNLNSFIMALLVQHTLESRWEVPRAVYMVNFNFHD
jgi:hypothetical protein